MAVDDIQAISGNTKPRSQALVASSKGRSAGQWAKFQEVWIGIRHAISREGFYRIFISPLAVGTFEDDDSHLFPFGWDMLVSSLEGNQLLRLVQEMVAFARYSVASLGSVPKVGFSQGCRGFGKKTAGSASGVDVEYSYSHSMLSFADEYERKAPKSFEDSLILDTDNFLGEERKAQGEEG